MGRRTREHTVKIFQVKNGEVINDQFICTHQDHAMESIKDYGDYYIEVYDIAGNLIHSENKHLLEIKEEPVDETTNTEEIIQNVISETENIVATEVEIIIEKLEPEVKIEPKIVKKAPAKKAPAKKEVIKKAD